MGFGPTDLYPLPNLVNRYLFKSLVKNSVDDFNAVFLLKILAFIYILSISFFGGATVGKIAFFSLESLTLYYLVFDLTLKLFTPLPYNLYFQYIFLPIRRKVLIRYLVILTVILSPFLLIGTLFWIGHFQFSNSFDSFIVFRLIFFSSVSTVVSLNLKIKFFDSKGLILLIAHLVILICSLQYKYLGILSAMCLEAVVFALSYFNSVHLLTKRISVDYFHFSSNVADTILADKIQFFSNSQSLFSLDWRLVARSKRALTYLVLSVLFILMFFNLLIETDPRSPFYGFILSAITSLITIQYGQYIFSWEGSFIDFYFLNTNTTNLITSKFQFFYSQLVLNFTILILLILISDFSNIELIGLCSIAIFFHKSITTPIIIFIGFFQRKKINLDKGALFNYEGTSGAVFVIIFFCVFPFGILYMLFEYSLGHNYTWFFLLCIGLLGLIKEGFTKKLLAKRMNKIAKYELLENFGKE